MSDLEVISISSGDTSPSLGESPVVVLSSVLDTSFDPPDSCASSACFEHRIDANELNAWLSEHPPTKCKQTKKNHDGTRKYEYRQCSCGCSYKITLIHEEDDKILFKETLLPPSHDESVGLKRSASIRITNEVHQRIDYLAKHHLFDPNYGTKKVCDMCI
jgi:hypothetical protein